jgi:hypothetical protein
MQRIAAVSAAVLVCIVFYAGTFRAAQQDSFLATFESEGTVQCSVFNTATGVRRVTYEWWLLGFVSGAGFVRGNVNLPMTKVDAAGAVEWTTKYCAQRPKEMLASAAGALVAVLSPSQ